MHSQRAALVDDATQSEVDPPKLTHVGISGDPDELIRIGDKLTVTIVPKNNTEIQSNRCSVRSLSR